LLYHRIFLQSQEATASILCTGLTKQP
jgi:hypothetical protein